MHGMKNIKITKVTYLLNLEYNKIYARTEIVTSLTMMVKVWWDMI
jgi:hypothetical protein